MVSVAWIAGLLLEYAFSRGVHPFLFIAQMIDLEPVSLFHFSRHIAIIPSPQ